MNAVATTGARPPTVVAPDARPRPGLIATMLERRDSDLLGVFGLASAVTWPREPSVRSARLSPVRADGLRAGQIWEREKAAEYLAAMPPAPQLEALLAACDEATAIPRERRAVVSLVGLMVDGFPNGRPHQPEVYVTTLVHEAIAGDYPLPAIAQACRQVAREARFLPTVAEFLAACGGQTAILHAAGRLAAEALEVRRVTEAALAEADDSSTRSRGEGENPCQAAELARQAEGSPQQQPHQVTL